MPTLRDRWMSGVYIRGIDTHQEARDRRSARIRELSGRHSNLAFAAQFSGPSRELRQAAEVLDEALKTNPAIRTRMSLFGFTTSIPGRSTPIHIYT